MRIESATVTLHERSAPPLERRASGSDTAVMALLRVVTDDGIVGRSLIGSMMGWGEILGPQVAKLLVPRIVGRDPLDIGAIHRDISDARLADQQAIGAVDVALWDIAGQAAALPIHRLLGSHRTVVDAYFASWYYTWTERYIEEALHFQAEGWSAYKIHPFCDAERDIALATAVREAVGDSMRLMLDPHGAYRLGEAVRVADALHELGFVWLEDPLPTHDIHGYSRLCAASRIPIIATELTPGANLDYGPWITEHATDALRGDVALKGGITPLMKIGHLAEAFGMPLEIHDSFNAVGNTAALHVNCGLGNAGWMEVLSVDAPGRHTLDSFDWGLATPLDIRGGRARVPEAPGLGVELDEDLLARTLVGRLG